MSITEKQKRWLKKQVHHLKPVVMVGQAGVTAPVLAEIELALLHHELIKVKISVGDRELRDEAVREIAEASSAEVIDRIGNTAAFYRTNPRRAGSIVLPEE